MNKVPTEAPTRLHHFSGKDQGEAWAAPEPWWSGSRQSSSQPFLSLSFPPPPQYYTAAWYQSWPCQRVWGHGASWWAQCSGECLYTRLCRCGISCCMTDSFNIKAKSYLLASWHSSNTLLLPLFQCRCLSEEEDSLGQCLQLSNTRRI